MKNLAPLVIIITIMSMTSCIDLPDLNPDTNENVVVTTINETYDFGMGDPFYRYLDINGNGTYDFAVHGTVQTDPFVGQKMVIGVESLNPRNHVIKGQAVIIESCGSSISVNPIKALTPNFIVNYGSQWGSEGAMYTRISSSEHCSASRSFVRSPQLNYIGVEFFDGDEMHYGWISISNNDTNPNGLPSLAEQWTIHEVAYNSVPGTGLRIPG